MIKRKYFFSVKVAHNNDSGQYSWWHSVVTQKSLFADPENLIREIRSSAVAMLRNEVPRDFKPDDVEIIAFNRV